MPAAKDVYTIEQGATFHKRYIWQDRFRQGINLTGCSVRLVFFKSILDQTTLLEASTDNGRIVITDALAGIIDIDINETITAGINWPRAMFRLMITMSDGTVIRLVQGHASVV